MVLNNCRDAWNIENTNKAKAMSFYGITEPTWIQTLLNTNKYPIASRDADCSFFCQSHLKRLQFPLHNQLMFLVEFFSKKEFSQKFLPFCHTRYIIFAII